MDDKITTTATLAMIFGTLTVGYGHNYKSYYPIHKKSFTYSEVIDTKVQSDNYLEEKYIIDSPNMEYGMYDHLEFFNFIQNIEFPQKEVDADIIAAMNEFEKLTSKKIPTKKRL